MTLQFKISLSMHCRTTKLLVTPGRHTYAKVPLVIIAP